MVTLLISQNCHHESPNFQIKLYAFKHKANYSSTSCVSISFHKTAISILFPHSEGAI